MILAPQSETIVWAALSIWKKRALVKWLRDSSLNQLIIHTTFILPEFSGSKSWSPLTHHEGFTTTTVTIGEAPMTLETVNSSQMWQNVSRKAWSTFWFVPKVPRPSVVSKHRFAATSTSRALGQGDFAWLDGVKIRWKKKHYFWRTSLTTTEIEKNSESGSISYLKSTNKTFICIWFNALETGNIEIGFRVFLTSISHIRELFCQVAKVGPLKVLSARQQPNLSPNSDFGDTKE